MQRQINNKIQTLQVYSSFYVAQKTKFKGLQTEELLMKRDAETSPSLLLWPFFNFFLFDVPSFSVKKLQYKNFPILFCG
jgi:hypothetical protein